MFLIVLMNMEDTKEGIVMDEANKVTYEEILNVLMEDETWEVPKEEREMFRYGMEWFFIAF